MPHIDIHSYYHKCMKLFANIVVVLFVMRLYIRMHFETIRRMIMSRVFSFQFSVFNSNLKVTAETALPFCSKWVWLHILCICLSAASVFAATNLFRCHFPHDWMRSWWRGLLPSTQWCLQKQIQTDNNIGRNEKIGKRGRKLEREAQFQIITLH